jgi:hypothetical protein
MSTKSMYCDEEYVVVRLAWVTWVMRFTRSIFYLPKEETHHDDHHDPPSYNRYDTATHLSTF